MILFRVKNYLIIGKKKQPVKGLFSNEFICDIRNFY